MGTMFEIPGWEEFTKRCQNVVDKWDAKKALLLEKMGTICQAEIKAEIDRGEHVDTSRLIDSISVFVGGIPHDYVEVGTNVEYALYVNDGHAQHRRFLPIKYISVNGKGLNKTEIIAKYGEKFKGKKGGIGGIMLKERYIPGVFFLENGMQAATPRMKRLGESFMVQIGREIEGG